MQISNNLTHGQRVSGNGKPVYIEMYVTMRLLEPGQNNPLSGKKCS